MLKITVTKRGLPRPEGLKRHVKEAMIEQAEGWRKNTMPKHFEKGAARKYKYNTRTKKYQNYKNRRGIGPLQFRGKAKRIILGDQRPARGTAQTITLRVRVPISFFRRYVSRIEGTQWKSTMADELTTILPAEVRAIGRQVQKSAVTRLKAEQRIERNVYLPVG